MLIRAGWPLALFITLLTAIAVNLVSPPTVLGQVTPENLEIIVQQNGLSWKITPLVGAESPAEFYSYAGYQSENPLVRPQTSLIFLYRQAGSAPENTITLFFIHGRHRVRASADEGTASFSFWGLPATAFTLVKDDPDDTYGISPPSGRMEWSWAEGFTDGAVLAGLTGEFTLTIYPSFDGGIDQWLWVSGSLQDPRYISLPSLTTPLTLQVRLPDPLSRFTYRPAEPVVGEPVYFEASASRSSAGPLIQFRWDFDGDNLIDLVSSTPSATHIFPIAGEHTVTLQVVDSLRRVASQTQIVRVSSELVLVTRRIKTFLPDFQTLPGYHFIVELLVETKRPVFGLGFKEEPPENWRIQPMENAGAQFSTSNSIEWLFLETLPAGESRKLTYRIDVPERAEPGVYRFNGTVVSGLPQTTSTIQGDTEVRVVNALSVEVAISRLNDKGELDLTLGNLIRFNQILQAVALWQGGEPVPGTNGKRIDLSMMVRLVAYWLTDTPVHLPLPNR